jgi:hypothetical protein
MVEGLAPRIIISEQARDVFGEYIRPEIIYAYEEYEGNNRKLYVLSKEYNDNYCFSISCWNGNEFSIEDYTTYNVPNNIPILETYDVEFTQAFGEDFYHFIIDSNNNQLYYLYNKLKYQIIYGL